MCWRIPTGLHMGLRMQRFTLVLMADQIHNILEIRHSPAHHQYTTLFTMRDLLKNNCTPKLLHLPRCQLPANLKKLQDQYIKMSLNCPCLLMQHQPHWSQLSKFYVNIDFILSTSLTSCIFNTVYNCIHSNTHNHNYHYTNMALKAHRPFFSLRIVLFTVKIVVYMEQRYLSDTWHCTAAVQE